MVDEVGRKILQKQRVEGREGGRREEGRRERERKLKCIASLPEVLQWQKVQS